MLSKYASELSGTSKSDRSYKSKYFFGAIKGT